jgi:antitoxin component of MazEF toxin-antitoxin module
MEVSVAQATVGKWGKNLAIRFPLEIAKAARLSDGERVEIEARAGDIVIRRLDANADADARLAAEEIIEESGRHTLDGVTIRELLDEGRRG